MTKSETIQKIIEITGSKPEKYFDKLSDHTAGYLTKLLEICKKLKK